MRVSNLTLTLCLCFASNLFGQQVSQLAEPTTNPGLVRVTEATAVSTRGLTSSSRRTQDLHQPLIVNAPESQPVFNSEPVAEWGSGTTQVVVPNPTGFDAERLTFNSTNPKSRLLLNPDQFWTRKSRPVIDQRNEGLFGDPNCACDEWKGFCGCCGFKANPGHLGIRSLQGGEPCECVDNCCPAPACRKGSAAQCR